MQSTQKYLHKYSDWMVEISPWNLMSDDQIDKSLLHL